MAKRKTLLDKKIDELFKLKKTINEMQNDVVKTIFTQYPNLNSIELESNEEYDDNNYYTRTTVCSLNGISFDESISDGDLEYLEESDSFKGALVEMNLKMAEVSNIIETLFCLDTEYLSCHSDFKRENFLK